MFKMSEYSFLAGLISIGLALLCYVLAFASIRLARRQSAMALEGSSSGSSVSGGSLLEVVRGPSGLADYGTLITWLALVFVSAALVFRTIHVGHGPFSNMYEFSVAFAWGVLAAYVYFERRYRQRALGLFALPVALVLMLYATTIPSTAEPLVPALQNSLLLSTHVAVAIVAYGGFAVAFAAAALHLIASYTGSRRLPRLELLDEISYRAVVIGFPFLTLVIVLGAVWANVAWGRYWGWDPKETASLVTWLIYGAYLHARVVRGWRGNRAALLLVVGFAATLFTYFGNLFFGGLHSYSGLS
jgi:cytochrome c-type biogenesis protein CcsB